MRGPTEIGNGQIVVLGSIVRRMLHTGEIQVGTGGRYKLGTTTFASTSLRRIYECFHQTQRVALAKDLGLHASITTRSSTSKHKTSQALTRSKGGDREASEGNVGNLDKYKPTIAFLLCRYY